MKGTEKQIAWANDIKSTAFAHIESIRNSCYGSDIMTGEKVFIGYSNGITAEAIDKVENQLTALFEKVDDAALIIHNRYKFTRETIVEAVKRA